jgi:hypothetical protein
VEAPTQKQIDFANALQIDVEPTSKRVLSAYISDYLYLQNKNSIESQQLKPDDSVLKKNDPFGQRFTISSIAENGMVYFKGGNGQCSWAGNIVKIA